MPVIGWTLSKDEKSLNAAFLARLSAHVDDLRAFIAYVDRLAPRNSPARVEMMDRFVEIYTNLGSAKRSYSPASLRVTLNKYLMEDRPTGVFADGNILACLMRSFSPDLRVEKVCQALDMPVPVVPAAPKRA